MAVAIVIAALLFEMTMLWHLDVGAYMVALGEFAGLGLLVIGYIFGCIPAAFGLLVATGRLWFAFTQALWIGASYCVAGFLLLEYLPL